ncbi:hypothetical protein DF3PA_270003 [Candidatus Defluviicoccus seviourii]|uniref:Uncharacterized protein n=1 Tax=Candidatus Defluviicoccus seviourii TaxID=2565273 RepID=A0A564WDZ7_9PROT|nr:hypothetical protein DF3PA_270003 [Candidatus Defluviicoccus seviourii]
MAVASVVVVREDADGVSFKVRVQLGRPLVGAAGVAGDDKSETGKPIDILLDLDDEDRILGCLGAQLEQTVRHLADALDPPRPAAPAIRPALPEVFRLEVNDLEPERTGLVTVVLGGNEAQAFFDHRTLFPRHRHLRPA